MKLTFKEQKQVWFLEWLLFALVVFFGFVVLFGFFFKRMRSKKLTLNSPKEVGSLGRSLLNL